MDAPFSPPPPVNETVLNYAPGSPERAELKATLARMAGEVVDVPMFLGGEEVRTGNVVEVRAPHQRSLLLARAHQGTEEHARQAIEAALRAHGEWASMPLSARAGVFLKAAELASTRLRQTLNAATMLGQSKTAHQAEIDAACELVDFFRYNVAFAATLAEQPASAPGVWNHLELRPLEGFVFAATPFNFTAIAANLPTAPALLGNTVVWKPSPNALYSAHVIMNLLREAGLPPGVVNMVNGSPEGITRVCLEHEDFAGVHFTGSTAVFRSIWQKVGENMGRYKTFPRLVGETGGKDFVFAHASADLDALAVALARGAFEFQGQKCSAASRAFIPASIWPKLEAKLVELVASIRVGDVRDFRNFMGAVIDERAHTRLNDAVASAKADPSCVVLAGGRRRSVAEDDGFFVDPTLVKTTDPMHRLMREELFGPVLTLWVYEDREEARALELCDTASPYALTGALFGNDRRFLERALGRLRFAAGNVYVNDKPTGAIVGQQPFGGARGSGTNDKAGSALNLHRWVSPRAIKETLAPPRTLGYPFLGAE